MFKPIHRLSAFASALLLAANVSYACTDIQVKATDGTQVIARTMEFAEQLNSALVTVPRGVAFTPKAPDGNNAKSWKSKYGYVMINGFNQMYTLDGMNEHGLTFEYLYLPGITKYQAIPKGKDTQAIPYFYLGDYVLGNFKTIDQVREALKSLYVYEQTLPATGKMVFPLHAAIHDATGQGIVVEFIDGEMRVNNYMSVMTNAPTYSWHLTQLREFLNLTPYNPKPIIVDGVSYGSNGQGSGMFGLPGDVSPSSRFVKMAYMLKYVYPAKDAMSAVNLAQHVLNNVDIPAGFVREKNGDKDAFETTQWSVYKDMTNKVLYYHTYNDLTLRSIDLKKLDFTQGSSRAVLPMASEPYVINMTDRLNSMD